MEGYIKCPQEIKTELGNVSVMLKAFRRELEKLS